MDYIPIDFPWLYDKNQSNVFKLVEDRLEVSHLFFEKTDIHTCSKQDILLYFLSLTISQYSAQDYFSVDIVDKAGSTRVLLRPAFDDPVKLESLPELVTRSIFKKCTGESAAPASDVSIAFFDCKPKQSKINFCLYFENAQLTIKVFYDSCLIEQWFVKQLLQTLASLLKNRKTQNASIEKNKQTERINKPPLYSPISKLFEKNLLLYPDKIALKYTEQSWTYRELNDLANQLGRYLSSRLMGDQQPIGICMQRSPLLIVSLLAILKSNNIYVPIEILYPMERKQYIIDSAKISFLIVDSSTETDFHGNGLRLINIESQLNDIKSCSAESLIYPAAENDAIAIYFTSGSTGRPHGVIEKHAGFYNRLIWSSQHYQLDKSDVAMQIISVGFGISFFEILHPLLHGATLIITLDGTQKNPAMLIDLINKHGVTFFHLVPTILQRLVDHPEFTTCKSLKKISCGGEVLTTKLYNQFSKLLDCCLFNAYGLTEISVAVTHHECSKADNYCSIPIGKPIDNVEIYVFDEGYNEVPAGAIGTLYVGGICLSAGYLIDERIIMADKKLYNTGDLVRKNSNNELLYIGRKDQQIKIKGCRINLLEIEMQLVKFPWLQEATVCFIEGENPHLVCFYKSALDESVSDVKVKTNKHLLKFLPKFMLPTKYIQTPEIPKNINGKIDKKSLIMQYYNNEFATL